MEKEVRLQEVFPVQEAVFDEESMSAKVTLIREGMNLSRPRKNYTKASIQQAVKEGIFNNMRMFVDHSNKPPIKRSIKDLVSGTGITEYQEGTDGKGKIVSTVKFFNKEFFNFAQHAQEHMGTSIDALVRGTRFRATDGQVQEDIHGFVKGHSVDWVVFPSAGGGIESFITAQEGVDVEDIEWGNLTPEMIKEHAPELYQSIMAAAPKPKDKEIPVKENVSTDASDKTTGEPLVITKETFEAKVQEAVTAAVTAVENKRNSQATVARQIAGLVDVAAMPARTKARVKASFDGIETFDETVVKEAITEAQAELKEVAGPRVHGMGVTSPDGEPDKEFVGPAREAVEAIFEVTPKEKKPDPATTTAGKKE